MEHRHIRQAREADHQAVVDCVRAAYARYLERMGREPAPLSADYAALITQGVVSVLEQGAEICGILVMMPRQQSMFVENIAIDPRFQGRGLGRQLMAFVEQRAQEAQLSEIRLYTNELMTENLHFYSKLGFAEEDRRVQDGYRRVFLRKKLV